MLLLLLFSFSLFQVSICWDESDWFVLNPVVDFNGTLLIENRFDTVLNNYDVEDYPDLHADDFFAGVEIGDEARKFKFEIQFTQIFGLRDIVVVWTGPTEGESVTVELYDWDGSEWVSITTDYQFSTSNEDLSNEYQVMQWEWNESESWADISTNWTKITVELVANIPDTGYVVSFFELLGVNPTSAPSFSPTAAPTTPNPTAPSPAPTYSPSSAPTYSPTSSPTGFPTVAEPLSLTLRDGEYASQSNFTYSDNVYPLEYRNQTYSTYTQPDGEVFLATAILAWGNIDAKIWVAGCDDLDFGVLNSEGRVIEPGAFYNCEGTWIVETSASLVTYQDTYGRLEIWELDVLGRKYLQQYFEFQWNGTECTMTYLQDTSACDVLPLTEEAEHAAMFRFTMPKLVTDNRNSPLIVVWYDLLAVPYSLRPVLNYTYWNFTFSDLKESEDLSLEAVATRFSAAFIAAGCLLAGFIVIMIIACVAADDAILKADYMLDTRDIRTTYIHSVTTLIAPQSDLETRSRFSMKRHGWWLFLVVAFRLMYMFIFTFIFFGYVFVTINETSFNTLDQYDHFAYERDIQLTNQSSIIEAYYINETDRMGDEVDSRQFWCYEFYINATSDIFDEESMAQYNNHSAQMENVLSSINLLNVSAELFISGSTACNINASQGAVIFQSDPYPYIVYNDDGDYNSTQYYYAENYDRSFDNFSFIEEYLTDACDVSSDCVGWTFVDGYYDNDTSEFVENAFYLLSELGSPINSDLAGLCYALSGFDSSEYDFSSVNALANYSNYLENLYLSNYQSDVDSMYDYFSNMWTELQGLNDTGKYRVEFIINPDATELNMDFTFGAVCPGCTNLIEDFDQYQYTTYITYDCPGCPVGNISNVYLQEVLDFIYAYNYTNFSDFLEDSASNTSISDFIAVDDALLEYPDIPEIDTPFDIDIDLESEAFWSLITTIFVSLDVILFVYRWYRTAGMVAMIVRGKDVEIRLKYLRTEVAPSPPCWNGKEIADKMLNCIIWCHDKMRHCSYNLWKMMYWVYSLMYLAILVLIILALYIIIDNVITEDFFIQLGAFDLITVGIAAQRSIRNEVICTTALGYNNFTLELLQQSRNNYADDKNDDSIDWNKDELDRVNDYNAYWCNAYTAYQASARVVTRDCSDCNLGENGYVSVSNITMTSDPTIFDDTIDFAFDEDDDTYWGIGNITLDDEADVYIDIELPVIQMTDTRTCYWTLSQIIFDWRVTGSGSSPLESTEYEVWAREDGSDEWLSQELETSLFSLPSSDTDSYQQANNVQWDIVVRYIRILFKDVGYWEDVLALNEVEFYGYADEDCIGCDTVTFYFWDFNAYDTYVELCLDITPVHGLMFRGWVRTWLNEQLIDGHRPFIRAVRSIALSPFAIMLVGAIILILVYILAFIIEWILIRVNMYRENPYAKVPLVHAKNSEFYDPTYHDVDDLDKKKDDTTYFGSNNGSSKSILTATKTASTDGETATGGGGGAHTKSESIESANAIASSIAAAPVSFRKKNVDADVQRGNFKRNSKKLGTQGQQIEMLMKSDQSKKRLIGGRSPGGNVPDTSTSYVGASAEDSEVGAVTPKSPPRPPPRPPSVPKQ